MINTIKIPKKPLSRQQSSSQIKSEPSDVNIVKSEVKRDLLIAELEKISSSSVSPNLSPCVPQTETKDIEKELNRPHKAVKRKLIRDNRNKQRAAFIHEKELIYQQQSSLLFSQEKPHQLFATKSENNEERLKQLFNEYSSETVFREWKPLSAEESSKLFQYAMNRQRESCTNH